MSIIKHVTLQKNVAHDFRYDPRNCNDVCDFVGQVVKMNLNARNGKYKILVRGYCCVLSHSVIHRKLVLLPGREIGLFQGLYL